MSKRYHELKTWPKSFMAMWSGGKTAEFRKMDRDFKVGDYLHLVEWDQYTKEYSGRGITCIIRHISAETTFGIPKGYGMLSLEIRGRWGRPEDRHIMVAQNLEEVKPGG